jgi:DNA-binding MarR family transcriptional regulator
MFEAIRKLQVLFMHSARPIIMEYGLNKTEIFVLMSVYHHKSFRVTDLAKMADVPASTFTGIIDRLVARKYLVRVNDPEDRRSVLVQGTKELQDAVSELMKKFNEKFLELLKPVPEELIQNTVENVNRVYEIVTSNNDVSAGCKLG